MKVAIIGSRQLPDEEKVYRLICDSIPCNCSEIVSGGAKGIDTLAKRYAEENKLMYKEFLPDYEKFGKRAPLLRNVEIVEYSDIVFAFWDTYSRGTAFTVKECIERHVPVKVIPINGVKKKD